MHWYVAQTRPRQEAIAELNLQRQGFTCYLPRLTQPKRVRGRWQDVTEVLFPGYIFIHLDLEQGHIAPLFSTKGIKTLVRFGTHYRPFAQHGIDYLQQQEALRATATTEQTTPFQEGEDVQILEGPLAGLKAVFQCSKARDRVQVLIHILGTEKAVELPADSVSSAA